MHPFERAGLGKAPFRCVEVTKNLFTIPGVEGSTKPGGHCRYCFTAITYEYHLVSADDRKTIVGCDCVMKIYAEAGEENARIDGFKEFRAKLAKEQRAAKREARARARYDARAERQAAERTARYADFSAAHPEVCRILDKLLNEADPEYPGDFMVQMANAVKRFGSLTAAQLEAVQANIKRTADRETQKASSRHVGQPGDRIDGEFELLAITDRETQYGTMYWHLLLMDGQNVATYSGSRRLGRRGDKVRGKFTVKAHDEYQGTLQTKLSRPKVEKVS